MNKPTIAITGANGFIGSRIATYFSGKGWNVIALVRNPSANKNGNILYRKFDLSQKLAGDILENVDYLVHAAYIKHDSKNPKALNQNILGTKNLLNISRNNLVKKNFLFSSLSAQYNADSTYGKQKHELEKIFNTKKDAVIRPGLVLGNGGLAKNMAHFMKTKHLVPLVDGGKQPLQIVDVDTIIQAIERIIKDDLHGPFTVASVESYSYKDFYIKLAKALNTRIAFIPVSYQLLIYPVKLLEKFNISAGITTDNLLGLKKMRYVDSATDLKKLSINIPSLTNILKRAVKDGL